VESSAGAREVWLCALDGTLSFHLGSAGNRCASSTLCPQFPAAVPRVNRSERVMGGSAAAAESVLICVICGWISVLRNLWIH